MAKVILERSFDVFTMDGEEVKRNRKGNPVRTGKGAVLRVFQPVYGDDKFGVDTWVCFYRIDGPEIAVARRLPGIDSLQACMCALSVAESDLHKLGERIGHLGRPGYTGPLVVTYTDRFHRDTLEDLHYAEQVRSNRLHQFMRRIRETVRRSARG